MTCVSNVECRCQHNWLSFLAIESCLFIWEIASIPGSAQVGVACLPVCLTPEQAIDEQNSKPRESAGFSQCACLSSLQFQSLSLPLSLSVTGLAHNMHLWLNFGNPVRARIDAELEVACAISFNELQTQAGANPRQQLQCVCFQLVIVCSRVMHVAAG